VLSKEQRGTLRQRSIAIRRGIITEELTVKTTKQIGDSISALYQQLYYMPLHKTCDCDLSCGLDCYNRTSFKGISYPAHQSFISQVLKGCHRAKPRLQYYIGTEIGYGNNPIQYHIHHVTSLEALLHSNPPFLICITDPMVPLQYNLIQYHIHNKLQTIKVYYVSPP